MFPRPSGSRREGRRHSHAWTTPVEVAYAPRARPASRSALRSAARSEAPAHRRAARLRKWPPGSPPGRWPPLRPTVLVITKGTQPLSRKVQRPRRCSGDGVGRVACDHGDGWFFFELDRETETHERPRAKLRRYAEAAPLPDLPNPALRLPQRPERDRGSEVPVSGRTHGRHHGSPPRDGRSPGPRVAPTPPPLPPPAPWEQLLRSSTLIGRGLRCEPDLTCH